MDKIKAYVLPKATNINHKVLVLFRERLIKNMSVDVLSLQAPPEFKAPLIEIWGHRIKVYFDGLGVNKDQVEMIDMPRTGGN